MPTLPSANTPYRILSPYACAHVRILRWWWRRRSAASRFQDEGAVLCDEVDVDVGVWLLLQSRPQRAQHCIDRNYIGHSCAGNNCICRSCIGHDYIGRVSPVPTTAGRALYRSCIYRPLPYKAITTITTMHVPMTAHKGDGPSVRSTCRRLWACAHTRVRSRHRHISYGNILFMACKISTSPTACPSRGYGHADTQNDHLGRAYLRTGMPR